MYQTQSFTKFIMFLLTRQLTKMSNFIRESGEFLSLFMPLLLLTVVDAAPVVVNMHMEAVSEGSPQSDQEEEIN